VHPSDGSTHMILSASDAKTVIDRGWGERHPLAGVLPGLPETNLLIYPPRTAGELAVAARIGWSGVAHGRAVVCSGAAGGETSEPPTCLPGELEVDTLGPNLAAATYHAPQLIHQGDAVRRLRQIVPGSRGVLN
jgi:hypothetical protein